MNEQQIRLAIVQDLMRLHQVVDTAVIIKQAQTLSDFVINGDGFIQAQSLGLDKAKQKPNTTALCQLYVLAH